MQIEVKSRKSVREFVPLDMEITVLVDGVERVVRAWNTEDDYDTEWREEDRAWYEGLSDEDSDQIYDCIREAFHTYGPVVLNEVPDEIVGVHLDAIVMPNGEVISCGKVLGRVQDFKGVLFVK